jgi:hypothetical protein
MIGMQMAIADVVLNLGVIDGLERLGQTQVHLRDADVVVRSVVGVLVTLDRGGECGLM